MDWGQRFQRLLEQNTHPDGRRWSGAEIERATRGNVSRYYVSRLRRGLIRDPGVSKIVAISKAMGISLDTWIEQQDRVP